MFNNREEYLVINGFEEIQGLKSEGRWKEATRLQNQIDAYRKANPETVARLEAEHNAELAKAAEEKQERIDSSFVARGLD